MIPFSGVPLDSAGDVLIFILTCSAYVCSILWIYGDAATRGLAGWKGASLPLSLVVVGLAASAGHLYLLVLWPLAGAAWILRRPGKQPLTED